MNGPSTRLLCLGDMHLGRASGRIPPQLDHDLTPRDAWAQAVRLALAERVQAVLLAGDVVDEANDRFEAYGALERGVRTLVEAGIGVMAVAGNHDHEALPRLADLVGGMRLLGRGGRWETGRVDGPGGPVHVVGWSFPGRVHAEDPAAAGLPPREADGATVGLLHADLDAGRSPYAPTATAHLRRAGYDAWLLGHVHRPTLAPGPGAIGYLGCLVGLDPGEPGPRGPWLLAWDGARLALEHRATAPLSWATLDVEVTGVDPPQVPDRILAVLAQRLGAGGDGWDQARVVGVRVRLVGRHDERLALERVVQRAGLLGEAVGRGERAAFIDDVAIAVDPAHDLAALAAGSSPAAALARRLLDLREGRRPDLVAAAQARVQEVDRRAFAFLADDPPGEDDLRARLVQAGLRVLDALAASREATDGAA